MELQINDKVWYYYINDLDASKLPVSELRYGKIVNITPTDDVYGKVYYKYVVELQDGTVENINDFYNIFTDEQQAIDSYDKELIRRIEHQKSIINIYQDNIKRLQSMMISDKFIL